MVIRESTSHYPELDLSGTPKELREIARIFSGLKAGESCRFGADAKANPDDYQRCLESFLVCASGGPVRLSVNDNELQATGSAEMLTKFASFFDFPDDEEPGIHHHHEYLGERYIAPDSRPLVVSVAD